MVLFLSSLSVITTCFAETQEYRFAKDFIKGLQCRMIIVEKYGLAPTAAKSDASDVSDTMTNIKNLHLTNNELNQAKYYMEQYAGSKNEIMARTSRVMVLLYELMIKNNNERIKIQEYLDSPQAFNDIQEQGQGKMASEVGKILADGEKLEKDALQAAIMVTNILVSYQPDENGKRSYLAITKKEQDDLMEDLESAFGPSIKDGMKAGMSYLEASGAAFYDVFKQPYKYADER